MADSQGSDAGPSIAGNNTAGSVKHATFPDIPSGHRLRRATTVDDSATFRRRPTFADEGLRRRGSNFSEFSQDARDTINPSADLESAVQVTSKWDALPLAFALLPAVGGILINGGNAVVTDLMLLGLGAVFLNWSVTQPWSWYHSAQQVRVYEGLETDLAVDSDSDNEESSKLTDVSEEYTTSQVPKRGTADSSASAQARQAALKELYMHEVLALISCFLFPVLGAYLLHGIRGQLTRPSEGLVSNYNLTIFILGAEVRPLRHLIRLIQARTLHLQRIVNVNPYREETPPPQPAAPSGPPPAEFEELLRRLDDLESRADAADVTAEQIVGSEATATKRADARREKDNLVRELRTTIQPELDTLARALRRTHKQQGLFAAQVESKFRVTDHRLNDALSLAAAAARNSRTIWTFMAWLFDWVMFVILLPLQILVQLGSWPVGIVFSLFSRGERSSGVARNRRFSRTSKPSIQSKPGIERGQRVSRR